jgi:hypothetical protein
LLAGAFTVVILMVSTLAVAHEGGIHVKGAVVAVEGDILVVKTTEGAEQRFTLTKDTTFSRDGRSAPRTELAPGDRVVVHARRAGGRMEATEVRFSKAALKVRSWSGTRGRNPGSGHLGESFLGVGAREGSFVSVGDAGSPSPLCAIDIKPIRYWAMCARARCSTVVAPRTPHDGGEP